MSTHEGPGPWPTAFEAAGTHARLLGEADAALFVALYGDPATMHHVGPPLDPAAATRAFAAARGQMTCSPPRACYWRLTTAQGAQGLLSLVFDAGRRSAETGLLLPAAAQRQGVARAVLDQLCAAVFHPGRLDAVWTRHRAGHTAASGLMQRLGFRPGTPRPGWQHWTLQCHDRRERTPASAIEGAAHAGR